MGTQKNPTRSDTMGGSTKNSGWVAGAYVLGESNRTNVIEMSHYINNIGHPHSIYITIKYGLAYTVASVTYISSDYPHKNTHKQGHTVFFSSACVNKLTSNTSRTLAFP